MPILLHDGSVELDARSGRTQVLDEIPVDTRLVDAAEIRVAVPERDVHGAVHLLVEERVLHVARDARVAADPELAEPARALVGVEHLQQELLVGGGGGVDDASAVEAEPDSGHLAAVVDGRKLGEADLSLGGVLEWASEELAAGQIGTERIDFHRATLEGKAYIRLRPDDPHLARSVEATGDPLHALALGGPVAQDGSVQEIGELFGSDTRFLRERVRRILAGDPSDLVAHDARHRPLVGRKDELETFRLDRRSGACVLGCGHEQERVCSLELVREQRCRFGDELQGCLAHPAVRLDERAVERDPEQGVSPPAGDGAAHLLEQRRREWIAPDEHLPAGLYAETAVDDELCVFPVASVAHGLQRTRRCSTPMGLGARTPGCRDRALATG